MYRQRRSHCSTYISSWILRHLESNPGSKSLVSEAFFLLNKDRNNYVNQGLTSFEDTKLAISLLINVFRNLSPVLKNILPRNDIVIRPREKPYTVYGRSILVQTGSTDGYTIQFYARMVTSKWFDGQAPAFGGSMPPGMHHYAVVMIHEFGHVVHRALRRNWKDKRVRNMTRDMLSNGGVDCWMEYSKVFEDQSEWFADMFVRTLLRAL